MLICLSLVFASGHLVTLVSLSPTQLCGCAHTQCWKIVMEIEGKEKNHTSQLSGKGY